MKNIGSNNAISNNATTSTTYRSSNLNGIVYHNTSGYISPSDIYTTYDKDISLAIPECHFLDKCKSKYTEKCETCKFNEKRDYYVPTKTEIDRCPFCGGELLLHELSFEIEGIKYYKYTCEKCKSIVNLPNGMQIIKKSEKETK